MKCSRCNSSQVMTTNANASSMSYYRSDASFFVTALELLDIQQRGKADLTYAKLKSLNLDIPNHLKTKHFDNNEHI